MSRLVPYPLSLALVLALVPGGAAPADVTSYDGCMALVARDGDTALEEAARWAAVGGGLPARHCHAAALVQIGQPGAAARELEAVANEMVREAPALRAEVLGQAADAWLTAGHPEWAEPAITTALFLAPHHGDFQVIRARILAERRDWAGVVAALNQGLLDNAPRAQSFAYRAAAYRHLGDLKSARADGDRAVAADPKLAAGWLERGLTRYAAGDNPGARQDWLRVLALAPDSAAADVARDGLARMDVHIEDAPAR